MDQLEEQFPPIGVDPTGLSTYPTLKPAGRLRLGLATWIGRLYRHALPLTAVLVIGLALGRSAPESSQLLAITVGALTGRDTFGLVRWEQQAIGAKWQALTGDAAPPLTADEEPVAVLTYLENAQRLAAIDGELERLLSLPDATDEQTRDLADLAAERSALHLRQEGLRPRVERIIEQQVSAELRAAGLGGIFGLFPPLLFTFTEPPKTLIVSPRDRIETVYSRMLTADIDLLTVERREEAIAEATGHSAYITNIGGLGAYPTMVIDRAPIDWILSTVAHEWVHNYLTLFPLGIRYGASADLVTINETVADIVGDEIGARVVRRYYPAFAPPMPAADDVEPSGADEPQGEEQPPPFDFRTAMRETRLHVDSLLQAGQVAQAEAYMETRRRFFVANGYALRVLNQAYFAFHGSYATGPASSNPIGPKLQRLRAEEQTLADFLWTVRWFTQGPDLDRALAPG